MTSRTADNRIAPAGESVVAFRDVSLAYGNAAAPDDALILKSLNFQLAAGSFHFLTGPSGAGKTSLLKMIYLAQTPS